MFFNDFKVLGAKIIRETTLNLAKIPFCEQTAFFFCICALNFVALSECSENSECSGGLADARLAVAVWLWEAAAVGLGDEKSGTWRMPLTTLKLFIYGSLKQ